MNMAVAVYKRTYISYDIYLIQNADKVVIYFVLLWWDYSPLWFHVMCLPILFSGLFTGAGAVEIFSEGQWSISRQYVSNSQISNRNKYDTTQAMCRYVHCRKCQTGIAKSQVLNRD